MFPFGPPDPPDRPGPVRHITYVLATDSKPKVPMLLLAYTSSVGSLISARQASALSAQQVRGSVSGLM